jgi:manganese oxidase
MTSQFGYSRLDTFLRDRMVAACRRQFSAYIFVLLTVCSNAPTGLNAQETSTNPVLLRAFQPALPGGKLRTYYIAAEEIDWNYAPSGRDEMMGMAFMANADLYVKRESGRPGLIHRKAVYVEYSDDTFKTQQPKTAAWAHTGILGPTLRAEVGDVIRVIFKNSTTRDYSMHPHGVFYLKADEGAPSNDGTSLTEKRDDVVRPGETQVYVWKVPERAGPGPKDGSSIAWLYHSHTDRVRDTNAGLIGVIIITRRGQARDNLMPRDVDREFISFWKIYDENQSPYLPASVAAAGGNLDDFKGDSTFVTGNRMHTVNGFVFGNLPLDTMSMRAGERVRWYVIGLGGVLDLHTPHWHGSTVIVAGQRTDVISLLPAQHVVADMIPDNPGIWMIHCHVDEHLDAGMSARYQVLPREARAKAALGPKSRIKGKL